MRTILVQCRDSQGIIDHMMTTDAARELVEEKSRFGLWIYADNQLIEVGRVNQDIDWESVSCIRIFPALRVSTPQEGEEE